MQNEQQFIKIIQHEYARLKQAGADAQSAHHRYSDELEAQFKQQLANMRAKSQQEQNIAAATRARQLDALSKRFQSTQASIRGQIWNTTNTLSLVAAEWGALVWHQFSPQTGHDVPTGMRIGLLKPHASFKLPAIPALVPIVGNKHLLISFQSGLEDASNAMLQSAALRLIAAFPAGAFRLTLVDAYRMGANLTAFLTLPEIIHKGHVFCNEREIEDELGEVSKHITNVIQTRLRYTFHTIEEYNQRVGEVSVPYQFVLIANFPSGFSDAAAQHLVGIARNGPSAGVYIIVTRNRDIAPPFHCDITTLEDASIIITAKRQDEFMWNDPLFSIHAIQPDQMPPEPQVKSILDKVGKAALQQGSRGLAFTKIVTPKPWWTRKSDERLTAAIGVSGSGTNHEFDVGAGVVHHAMVGGQTGSGKTNLLHVLISNLALTYSPDELEMYLVDFKEGVEFQDYVAFDLPQARAVSIESEREFGLSILHRMQNVMEQRGQIFRAEQVSSLSEYRRKTGKKMPRVLLIMDEYQILFREDDRLSQDASNVLADLVRRGRSFGIHIVLSSQSPSSTFISNRTVYDQIALRICMQCREADARLVLGDDNDEAKTLERPGEAIYNSENGRPDKNAFLRVALFPTSERRQFLSQIRQLGQQSGFKRSEPLAVFQGSALARIQDNRKLWQAIWSAQYGTANTPAFAWLGEAIEIKDHTAAAFERQSRSNLLIVGQEEAHSRGMLAAALLSLSAQRRPKDVTFFVLDLGGNDPNLNQLFPQIRSAIPHHLEIFNSRQDAEALLKRLASVVEKRSTQTGNPGIPQIFFFLVGAHRYRELRSSDPYTQSEQAKTLMKICQDGPEFGVHTLLWCDNMANVSRILQRSGLEYFDARVATLIAANESSELFDGPQASRLGSNRAYFRHQEWEAGRLEKFKPYALAESQVIAEIGKRLGRKV